MDGSRGLSVLLTTPVLGGSGGVERYTYAATQALTEAGATVAIVFDEFRGGNLGNVPSNVTAVSHTELLQVVGARPWVRLYKSVSDRSLLRKKLTQRFDVHLAVAGTHVFDRVTQAGVRVLNPSGHRIHAKQAPMFDLVAMQAPSNIDLLQPHHLRTLLPPPLDILPDPTRPQVALPDMFFLTVFNPYGEVKGQPDLEVLVDALPMPIVWCHSADSINFLISSRLSGHPNVIHIDSPSRSELRWLYERTQAYVSVSRSEGFGWATADALRYSPIVIGRSTGVLSFPWAKELEGVHLYTHIGELDGLCVENMTRFNGKATRDLPWLSSDQFVSKLLSLSDTRGKSEAGSKSRC
jgi:hypothetical protein